MNDTLPGLRPLHNTLLAAALALLLFYFAVYVVYAANLISFPFDYDQGEGFELVDTIMFSQFRWPYQDTETYPFYSSNYPPLYHVLVAPFVWLFGPGYWYGRLFNFICTLIAAAAIGLAVYRDGGRHRLIALLAGLAFLASNTIYHIGPLFRQHITMVMFEVLAVVILAQAFPQQRRGRIALGLGLLIAAGYTKQLAAITAVAILLWMFLRSPRRGLVWGALFAASGVAIFAWMTVSTGGEWWRQAVLANVNELNFSQIIGLFRLWLGLHGFLILPAVLLILYELYLERISLYAVWFLMAALLGGIGAGTWGGGDSYYATAIAAMCILSGIFASRLLAGRWSPYDNYVSRALRALLSRLPSRLLATAVLLLVPLFYLGYGRAVLHMPTEGPFFGPLASALGLEDNTGFAFYDSAGYVAGGYARIGYLTTPEDVAAGWRIVALIESTDRPVLSEEAGFSLAAGRDVITNPTQLLNLWLKGLYDGGELIDMIERQEFAYIILRAQFYPEPVLVAMARAYEQVETIHMNGFDYIILAPDPDPQPVP